MAVSIFKIKFHSSFCVCEMEKKKQVVAMEMT